MQGRSARGQESGLRRQTELYLPAPNPTNPGTTIRFSLADGGMTELCVYDVRGMRVRTLVSETIEPGTHEAYWDGKDDTGRGVASGTYIARLSTKSATKTQKLVLIQWQGKSLRFEKRRGMM